ncbi:hypothetical protein KEM55_005346 [Ascosphaera atra]|nr:hypothetical protein KEM55_005346 [Ascosphaera atra]
MPISAVRAASSKLLRLTRYLPSSRMTSVAVVPGMISAGSLGCIRGFTPIVDFDFADAVIAALVVTVTPDLEGGGAGCRDAAAYLSSGTRPEGK